MSDLNNEPLTRYKIPEFDTIDEARRIYAPPSGYKWRPVVIDALNFLAKEEGADWASKSYGGTCMARFAAFLFDVGATTVKFILSRKIVDVLLDREPSHLQRRDKNDFIWLFTREYIVIAPSWMNQEDVRIATNDNKKALELFELPHYRRSRSSGSGHSDPWKVNDDLITLHVGTEMEGVIVSADKFRDLKTYLPNTPLAFMHRVLRARQVVASCLDRVENVWRLDPMYDTHYGRRELPFWMPIDAEEDDDD